MKITTIAKISPIVEMSSPILLQCRTGECGGCPSGTGKLLWIPRRNSTDSSFTETFNLQYNFFNRNTESTSEIKYNVADGDDGVSYSNRPTKAYTVANPAQENYPALLPSDMRGASFLTASFTGFGVGGWLFFRQPNPAIGNVHDALCFEYNHEKRLITFRSF